ncbi:MAG: BrnT family toxin [Methyloceanibacter sp.]|uniref:BrnT family toxin n=1 Tax=Methyloceanibacter sp. TaxID=1965321 RepID=UPI003D6CCEA8
MKIIWDEPKRRANLEARGLDLADLDLDFFAASAVIPAKHGRLKAIGPHGGKLLTVIYKPLGREALAVISMRPASRKERRAYEQDS